MPFLLALDAELALRAGDLDVLLAGGPADADGADQRAYDYRAKMIDRQNEAAPPGQRWYGN